MALCRLGDYAYVSLSVMKMCHYACNPNSAAAYALWSQVDQAISRYLESVSWSVNVDSSFDP